jgi:hypothetical protein
MLLGLWTHGGRPVVLLALPPGPEARHESMHFADDIEHFRSTSALMHEQFGMQPIGTWHSHHGLGLDEPSAGDVNQVRSITGKNGIQRWMEIITTHDGAGRRNHGNRRGGWPHPRRGGVDTAVSIKINCFFYSCAPSGERIRSAVRVIPGPSPLRQALIGRNCLSGSALGYQGWTFPMEHIQYDRLEAAAPQKPAKVDLHADLVKQIGKLPAAARDGMTVTVHEGLVVLALPMKADVTALVAYTATEPLRPHTVRLADRRRGISRDVTAIVLGCENGTGLLDLYERLQSLPVDEPSERSHEPEISTKSDEGCEGASEPRPAARRRGRLSRRSPTERR